MDYLGRMLHMNIKTDNTAKKYPLPNYILSRYTIGVMWIEGLKVFLLYPKTDLDSVNMIKKHIQKVQGMEQIPVALVLLRVTARQRQNLISAGIPFIVENKQCYLPFVGILLTEKCDAKTEPVEKLIPSAQMLLFYFIQKGKRELYANEAVDRLGVSAMTVTRAIRQLEQTGLINTYKQGVMKIITSECTGRELFEKAKPYLATPIKRKGFIPKERVSSDLLAAGESALSAYSMLNPPLVSCYATSSATVWKEHMTDELIDAKQQVELQIWKYNPRVLTCQAVVDVLSLDMCFADAYDERIEESAQEMMDAY